MEEQNMQTEQNKQTEEVSSQNHYQDYTAQVPYQSVPMEAEPQNNTLSVVSLILGILSIVGCCFGVGFMLGIGGIICSAFARKQGKNGMNMGGLITSIIGVAIGVIFMIIVVVLYVLAIIASY